MSSNRNSVAKRERRIESDLPLSARLSIALLLLGALGCGGKSERADAGPSSSAAGRTGTSGSSQAASCAPYGLSLAPDCAGCPKQPVSCDCGQTGSIYVSEHCTRWQQCVSVDCSAVCSAVSNGDESALFELETKLSECLSGRACERDAECPNGKCFQAVVSQPGSCSSATTDSPCLSAADCSSGICVLTSGGGRCEDGKLEQPCGSAADCQSKLCVASGVCFGNAATPLQGPLIPAGYPVTCPIHTGNQCQSGLLGSFCDAPADCQSGICVRLPGGLGRCTDGSPPSACNAQADCKVGGCVLPTPTAAADLPLGWCTNGGPGEFCSSSADCKTGGTCYATGNEPASCRAGVAHDPCRTDAECQSSICVQLKGAGSIGECTSGSTGDRCASDDDCKNQICLVPANGELVGFSYSCATGAAGDPCWNAGDCLSGNCGPPPMGKEGGLCLAP